MNEQTEILRMLLTKQEAQNRDLQAEMCAMRDALTAAMTSSAPSRTSSRRSKKRIRKIHERLDGFTANPSDITTQKSVPKT